jgi:hypothetical protein
MKRRIAMMIERIRNLYWAKPFKPFTIHLADGRSLAVTHPEFMALSPSEKNITVYQADSAAHTVNLALVTDVVLYPETVEAKN